VEEIVGNLKRCNIRLIACADDPKRVKEISENINDCLVQLESLRLNPELLVDLHSDECDDEDRECK